MRGIITTPHALASESGADILREGGTAIDAMVAAGATLSVVYPHMTGIGGDALWILNDGKVRTVMGLGQAGETKPEGGITLRGPGAVATTAGALASWQTAHNISRHEWRSPVPWGRLAEDAIYWARNGSPVSASQAFWIRQREALLDTLPDLNPLTRGPAGQLLSEGDCVRQTQLANSLEQLSRAGIEDFYQGELALALEEGFQKLNCGLASSDLRATKADEVTPVCVPYRKGTFYNFPPPSQGVYTAQAMATLNQYPLSTMENGSAAYYHLLVEAIKCGLLRRNRVLRDPLRDNWDFNEELAPQKINPHQAAPWTEQGAPADTIWMAATDNEGRTACLMQSLFHDFGSGCVIGDTGILWQNRAAGFNPNPKHPNAWSAGRRPAHTLNPSCYLGDDGLQLYFGSQGGDGQPQTQLVLATQLIDFGRSVEAALRNPRFLLGRSFFDSTDNLKLEADIGTDVAAQLRALGHHIEQIPALSPYTGQAGIIQIDQQGRLDAMHDPRGHGTTIEL